MTNEEANKIREHVHNVRNSLNNIVLNAELATMLLNNGSSRQDVEAVLTSILKQCRVCDKALSETSREALK